MVTDQLEKALAKYESGYQTYFNAHTRAGQQMLDPAPRWALWPGSGTVSFGRSMKDVLADNRLKTIMIEIETVLSGGVIEEILCKHRFKEVMREQWADRTVFDVLYVRS